MIMIKVKGIVPLKKIFRLNLIFWIVMGCGFAGFGQRGLKTTQTWKFWSQLLSSWDLQGCRSSALQGHLSRSHGAAPRGSRSQNEQYHTPLLFKIWGVGDIICLWDDRFNWTRFFLFVWKWSRDPNQILSAKSDSRRFLLNFILLRLSRGGRGFASADNFWTRLWFLNWIL